MKSSAATVESCHLHSSSPLARQQGAMFDQVQGAVYSECEVETDVASLELEMDMAALKLEMDMVTLKLETEMDVSQEISKQERYSVD
jgi:hypothetical protein